MHPYVYLCAPYNFWCHTRGKSQGTYVVAVGNYHRTGKVHQLASTGKMFSQSLL